MKSIIVLVFFICTISYGQRRDFKALNFNKADSIAALHKGASLKNLPLLVHKLTTDLTTDVEKFRAIYTWVSTNIANDYSGYLKTKKKRKKLATDTQALTQWNNSYTPKVFKKLIEEQKTACTGYAYLIRELSTLANIQCKIINGYGRTANIYLNTESIPNHSWNAVLLDNKWYLCDATWSAGKIIIDDGKTQFKSDFFDGYFLPDPKVFIKNHYPVTPKWALLQKPPTFKAFLEGPLIYKEAFKPIIIPTTPAKMHLTVHKNEHISFKLVTHHTLRSENLSLLLDNGSTSSTVQPKITTNKNHCTLQYTFSKAGKYDVHIKAADKVIATYVVRVKRKKA